MTRAYPNVQPGPYTATAGPLTQGGRTWEAQILNSPATVGNGRNATINIDYTLKKGNARLRVQGLSGTQTTTLALSGPENQSVTMGNGDRTLELEPGTSTLTAPNVAGATASVSSSPFTIKSNATTNVTVTYTAPPPPPPPPPPAATTGTITVTVTGLPAGVYAPIQ